MQDLYNSMKALQFGGMMVYPLLLLGVIALAIILDKAFVYLALCPASNRSDATLGDLSFCLDGFGGPSDVSCARKLLRTFLPSDPE